MAVSDEPHDWTEEFRRGYAAGQEVVMEKIFFHRLGGAIEAVRSDLKRYFSAQIGSYEDGLQSAFEAFLDRHSEKA